MIFAFGLQKIDEFYDFEFDVQKIDEFEFPAIKMSTILSLTCKK